MKARILPATTENLVIAAEAIRQGDVVGMPTETVYGLAGAAFVSTALSKIFDTKERPTFDPLIIHVAPPLTGEMSLDWLDQMGLVDASQLSPIALERTEALMSKFWPGPLTLVLPKRIEVPDLATSGLPTVALRMPKHPVAQNLIRLAGTPLAAPSANRFGRISPTTALAVEQELGDRISWILDGGPCEVGVESTVLEVASSGELTLLRPGGTPQEAIEAATGTRLGVIAPAAKNMMGVPQKFLAPGMLESHYAPSKPMKLLPGPVSTLRKEDIPGLGIQPCSAGLLLLSGDPVQAAFHFSTLSGCRVLARTLSRTGDLHEAARNLFSELRALDASEADLILAEPCLIEHGLGHAISDRLKRASAKRPG